LSHCLDGRAEDADFVEGLLQAMGVGADQVMDWAYAEADPRATVAGLARAVTALAGAGNASARAITDAAADHLAQHLAAAWAKNGRQDVPVWSYAGGVFQAGLMVQAVQDRLGRPPQQPTLPPVGGALVQAAKDAGWVVEDGWLARVAAGLQAGGG
jgi:glucosamine kinase